MDFIVDSDNVFRIEKTKPATIMNGVKVAEFAELHLDHLVNIVEAKSSSPQPRNSVNFRNFIDEIASKLSDSLLIINALRLNRFQNINCPDFPQSMRQAHFSLVMKYHLFLVIKGHEKGWLPPLQDALVDRMSAILQMWNIQSSSVKVINDVMARDMGLIV